MIQFGGQMGAVGEAATCIYSSLGVKFNLMKTAFKDYLHCYSRHHLAQMHMWEIKHVKDGNNNNKHFHNSTFFFEGKYVDHLIWIQKKPINLRLQRVVSELLIRSCILLWKGAEGSEKNKTKQLSI